MTKDTSLEKPITLRGLQRFFALLTLALSGLTVFGAWTMTNFIAPSVLNEAAKMIRESEAKTEKKIEETIVNIFERIDLRFQVHTAAFAHPGAASTIEKLNTSTEIIQRQLDRIESEVKKKN